jgi:putative addiction module component (TIGR02574 family)
MGNRSGDASMNKTLRDEVMKLSTAEKIELAHELWESIPPGEEEFELTPEQLQEIKRRIAEHERDPGSAVPWEEVRERLRARFG